MMMTRLLWFDGDVDDTDDVDAAILAAPVPSVQSLVFLQSPTGSGLEAHCPEPEVIKVILVIIIIIISIIFVITI